MRALARKITDLGTDLVKKSKSTRSFTEMMSLVALRKNFKDGPWKHPDAAEVRVALIGGYNVYPMQELLEHLLAMEGLNCKLHVGNFAAYASEILNDKSSLHAFKPQVTIVIPSDDSGAYTGGLADPIQTQRDAAHQAANSLLELCRTLHAKTGTDVILTNFAPSATHDLGPFRNRTLGSDWNFRRAVNLELGLNAPAFVQICDLEFLFYRAGALASRDPRSWFESKQPCSPDLLVDLSREFALTVAARHRAAKKVVVVDLDNTLWGGIIGDDGLEGIELGDTSPRGEAFKTMQRFILSLTQRGLLLAVCSKNEIQAAEEPFLKHPEMVLKKEHFVAFKANWRPKADNIREIAAELNLGLDSFIFIDDNPAEVELVRQLVPEVSSVLLPDDPADFVPFLQETRLFEVRSITAEDSARNEHYRINIEAKKLAAAAPDLKSYLRSLEMTGTIRKFRKEDVPRLAQLIGKSNQFNLTTRRRSEGEVLQVMADPDKRAFSVRLKDRFTDHGLIAILILDIKGDTAEIETWLMSCRVLGREVEEFCINEIFRIAKQAGAREVLGRYLPSPKNAMVADLYLRMGFTARADHFVRSTSDFHSYSTQIDSDQENV